MKVSLYLIKVSFKKATTHTLMFLDPVILKSDDNADISKKKFIMIIWVRVTVMETSVNVGSITQCRSLTDLSGKLLK